MIRRLLGVAPLRPAEGLGLLVGGVALIGFAIVTVRPAWSPSITGWVFVGIGALAAARGVIGIAGSAWDLLRSFARPTGWPGNRAPRTVQETAEVLALRPRGWEYLYFAGCLVTLAEALDQAVLDHELGYATPSGERVEPDRVVEYLEGATNDVLALISSLTGLMEADVQERAFGAPGEPGHPERIRHLAERWTSVYGDLMRWAARLRAASKPDERRKLFDRLARLIDQPLTQYREFVAAFVSECDRIPNALASGETVEVDMTLTLSIDEDAVEAFNAEMRRL